MLPDIRAVFAAIVAAVGLMMAAFGLVATLRVAQQHQSVALQADLATRGRSVLPAKPETPANSAERAIPIVDTPGPHVIAPVPSPAPESPAPASAAPAPASSAIAVQPLEPPVAATLPPAEPPPTMQSTQATPPSEPPIGGPLAEPPGRQTEAPPDAAADPASGNLKRAAAKKARAARLARARKAAAKRAAQSRRAKQPPSPSIGGTFGNFNQIGGTSRQ